MRMIGYCLRCHKVRQVRVTSYVSRMPYGLCLDCERKQR